MYDRTIDLQTKYRIIDLQRANQQRNWIRTALEGLLSKRDERPETTEHKQHNAEECQPRAA